MNLLDFKKVHTFHDSEFTNTPNYTKSFHRFCNIFFTNYYNVSKLCHVTDYAGRMIEMTSQIYYASPLFSNMEQQYNAHIVAKLRSLYPQESFYVPQEQTAINDKQAYADAKMIAQYDTEQLLKSKLMLAVLDGPTIDVGVASEIGVAYQAGIPIVALFSDSRQQGADHPEKIAALKDVAESQFPYVNLYTVGLVKLNGAVYATEDDWMRGIAAYL